MRVQQAKSVAAASYVSSVHDIIRLECAKGPNIGHRPASSVMGEVIEGIPGGMPMQEANKNEVSESRADYGFTQVQKRRWSGTIDASLANIPLLACCFITGLLDTTMFQAYGTFVSMQTGNTIFLALGASDQNIKPYDWARSLCSIGCFGIGAVFFSRLHRHLVPQPTQRGALALGFLVQATCVCIAAALAEAGAVNQRQEQGEGQHTDWREMAPIALLSFQAAGQIVASRVLGVNELPTVVITSLMCDLMSDPKLLARPVLTGNLQPVLWLVFGIKFVISIGWIFWRGQDPKEEAV
ncbi:hypothetical protein diail_5794 [Diaporthe ilicicola]|nr:hypothetical protein diail_5794 [Diaporthe ilicicola]